MVAKTEIEVRAEQFVTSLPELSDKMIDYLLVESMISERATIASWAYNTALSKESVAEARMTKRQYRLIATDALTMLARKIAKQGDSYLLDLWDKICAEGDVRRPVAESAFPF